MAHAGIIPAGSAAMQGVMVHNVCENNEWSGMHMRLQKYVDWLTDQANADAAKLQALDDVLRGFEEEQAMGGANAPAFDTAAVRAGMQDFEHDEPLYLVSDGMDVFFNDMTPLLEREGVQNLKQLMKPSMLTWMVQLTLTRLTLLLVL